MEIQQLPVFLISVPGTLVGNTTSAVYMAYVPNDNVHPEHFIKGEKGEYITDLFSLRKSYTDPVVQYYSDNPKLAFNIKSSSYIDACRAARYYVSSLGLSVENILDGCKIDIDCDLWRKTHGGSATART